MHGIVSLLDEEHNQKVENIWRELALDCGLTGDQHIPIAHFSWHVAASYQIARLRPVLQEIAAVSEPFFVRATGIGLFTGERPVVFISLVKDDLMLRFHKVVWQKVNHLSLDPSPYYIPKTWVPHITLAETGWPGRLACAMEKLVFQPFNWQIRVDNLALISEAEGHVEEMAFAFRFGKKPLADSTKESKG
jgi:2'-5' RNA ligase